MLVARGLSVIISIFKVTDIDINAKSCCFHEIISENRHEWLSFKMGINIKIMENHFGFIPITFHNQLFFLFNFFYFYAQQSMSWFPDGF